MAFDRKSYNAKYYAEHRAEYTERKREWRRNHPDKVRDANRQQYLKRKARKQSEMSE